MPSKHVASELLHCYISAFAGHRWELGYARHCLELVVGCCEGLMCSSEVWLSVGESSRSLGVDQHVHISQKTLSRLWIYKVVQGCIKSASSGCGRIEVLPAWHQVGSCALFFYTCLHLAYVLRSCSAVAADETYLLLRSLIYAAKSFRAGRTTKASLLWFSAGLSRFVWESCKSRTG